MHSIESSKTRDVIASANRAQIGNRFLLYQRCMKNKLWGFYYDILLGNWINWLSCNEWRIHFRGLTLGQHSSEETWQRCRHCVWFDRQGIRTHGLPQSLMDISIVLCRQLFCLNLLGNCIWLIISYNIWACHKWLQLLRKSTICFKRRRAMMLKFLCLPFF